MKLISVLSSLVLGVATLSAALPAADYGQSTTTKGCTKPMIRKDWRTLSQKQKINYLDAVKCLMHTPGKKTGIVSRFEDFLTEHQEKTAMVHFNAVFLPWHRLLLYEMERVLRSECGYRGAIPYWDMKQDVADFLASPVLNGRVSFGGNGLPSPDALPPYNTTAGGAITDGWFAGELIHVGIGNDTSPALRNITRNISQHYASAWLTQKQEDTVLSETDFGEFTLSLEGRLQLDPVKYAEIWGVHAGGHRAVGGDMQNAWSSPSDPLFYLHHANLDRIWATWQAANPEDRQWQMMGPIAPRAPFLGTWPYTPPAGNVTLDYVLDLGELGGDRLNVRVARVMDTSGSMPEDDEDEALLCYLYDQLA